MPEQRPYGATLAVRRPEPAGEHRYLLLRADVPGEWVPPLAAAILELVMTQPIEVVYQYITEPATALDAAMTAVEEGDPLTLGLLTAAAPPIRAHPLITAVLALAEDDEDAARDASEALI